MNSLVHLVLGNFTRSFANKNRPGQPSSA